MSKIGLVTLLVLIAGRSYTQQDYFVLIQSDNNQPFYVHIGGKIFSSSGQGHLIIPQLKDSTYLITIGFPKKLFPERQFFFSVNKRDLEFQLKNLGEKGWGLFNPHTLELKMPERTDTIEKKRPEGVKKDDAFSRLMAGVVSDTAVMYNTYAMEEPLKDSSLTAIPRAIGRAGSSKEIPATGLKPFAGKTDASNGVLVAAAGSSTGNADSSKKGPPTVATSQRSDGKPDSSKATPFTARNSPTRKNDSSMAPAHKTKGPRKAAFIEKLSERKSTTSVRLTYADHTKEGKTDTIRIIIPVDTGMQSSYNQSDTIKKGTGPPVLSAGALEELPRGGLDTSQKKERVKPVVSNSDCKNFATDYDVDKLKLKLFAAPKDEDKILSARKVFRSKCFTTKQMRILSEVFATDAGKYQFLETAYPFVSDDRFRELSDLLTDPFYISKFKTMVGGI